MWPFGLASLLSGQLSIAFCEVLTYELKIKYVLVQRKGG